jgi:hypothetical protein
VTVPAGTYETLRIDRHRIDRKRFGPESHTLWLAAGVGPVKLVIGDRTYELTKVEMP